jgi:hypothetical protein
VYSARLVGNREGSKGMTIHDEIAHDIAPLGGFLRCTVCGMERALSEMSIAMYLREGWLMHCGYTMTWITQKLADEETASESGTDGANAGSGDDGQRSEPPGDYDTQYTPDGLLVTPFTERDTLHGQHPLAVEYAAVQAAAWARRESAIGWDAWLIACVEAAEERAARLRTAIDNALDTNMSNSEMLRALVIIEAARNIDAWQQQGLFDAVAAEALQQPDDAEGVSE